MAATQDADPPSGPGVLERYERNHDCWAQDASNFMRNIGPANLRALK